MIAGIRDVLNQNWIGTSVGLAGIVIGAILAASSGDKALLPRPVLGVAASPPVPYVRVNLFQETV